MLRSSREASAVIPLQPLPSNHPVILKRAQRQTVQPADRNTQQQFNICASGFILYQILMRYWGCQPCGGAGGASPEGRETLHSCCQWTVETRRSWSWWWRSSNRGPRRCHQEGMNLKTAWSVCLNWLHNHGVMLIKAQCGHDCICTFKVLSGGISRGAGSQTGSLWTGLRTQERDVSHMQTPTSSKFLHLNDCFFSPPLYLLRWTGQRGAFTPQGVPLTDCEQRAGQDGAEVVEGPPLGSVDLISRGQDRSNRSREEPGE